MVRTRCWDGDRCKKPYCKFVHPGDPDYDIAPSPRDRGGGGSFGSHRDNGYSRDRRDSHERPRDSGWGDSRGGSSKGHVSPEPSSKGWGDSGWGNTSSSGGGWGNASPAQGTWGSASPARGGGWGDSTSAGGLGRSVSPSGGGWGNSAPSSRRTSNQFESKSPSKLPPTSPRGSRPSSPPRASPANSSKGRDREQELDRSREGRRESVDTGKKSRAGDMMDVDAPELPRASPAGVKPPSTTGATSFMPPPPLPPGVASQPLGVAAAPLGKATLPSNKSTSLPPPPATSASTPTPTPTPTLAAPTNQPVRTSPVVPVTQSTPISSVSTTQSTSASPATSTPALAPAPVVKQQASAATLANNVLPADQPLEWFDQAKEWIRIVNLLIHEKKKQDVARELLVRYEQRTDPSPAILKEAADMRANIATHEDSIRLLTQQFSVCLANMHASAASTGATEAGKGPSSVASGAPAFPGLDPEMVAKILSLEDNVSRMQSELQGSNSAISTTAGVSKENTNAKEGIQDVKEEVRKEVEGRAKAIESMKNDAAVTKSEIGTLKVDVEGMKMEVTKAYKGLGEAKTEMGKFKTQQDMLRSTVERVEQELADVQKERGDTSVEVEQQFQDLKQQIEQLKAKLDVSGSKIEQRRDEEKERKKAAKREREAAVASGDTMDVDEARPVKRVRLNLSAAPQEEATFPPELTEDIGGPSNERLKELVDKLHDHISMLEGEIGEQHAEMSEQMRELQDYVGFDSTIYSGGAGVELVGRSESAPPATSSQVAPAGGARLSAPPDVSLERTTGAQPALKTIAEDGGAGSRPIETLATIRNDMDKIMEQLLALNSAKGLWPESVAKNLIASGTESLAQLQKKLANIGASQSGANNSKEANGAAAYRAQTDETVKSMQAKMVEIEAARAEEMKVLKAEMAKLKAESLEAKAENAKTKTEMQELRSIIDEALTPGNSINPMARVALSDSTSVVPEVTALRELASIMPLVLKMISKPN